MEKYKYYNEEQKELFLETINPEKFPLMYWPKIFTALAKFEESLDKDLSCFTKTEIINTYKMLNSRTYETLMVLNINLCNYTMWCLQRNLIPDGQNHYEELDSQDIFGCIDQMQLKESIVTRKELLEKVRLLRNPHDQFMVLGLFEGIKGIQYQDLLYAKFSNINEKAGTIKTFSGDVLKISRELINIARESDNTYEYIDPLGRKEQIYGDYIIKVKYRKGSTDVVDHKKVATILERIIKEMDLSQKISGNSLYISGLIHFINQLAKENKCTSEELLYNRELFDIVSNQYKIAMPTRRRFLMKYQEFLI